MTDYGAASHVPGTFLDKATVLVRWVLGGVFLYFGLVKALHPVDFLKLVRQYDVFEGPPGLNLVAICLPWLEAFCGLLLLAGVAVRGTAVTVVCMLAPLTLLVLHRAWLLSETHGVPLCAIKFDCGCGAGEVFVCPKLLENLVLIGFGCWVSRRRNHRLCLRSRLIHPAV